MTDEQSLMVPEYVPPRPYSLAPKTFDEALRFAAIVAKSDFCPKDYRGKPESILVAIQMGAELGLAPMQSLQNICVINGRPSVWGDALLALVVVSPVCEYVRESEPDEVENTKTAWTEAKRKGQVPRRVSFTAADAKKAGLDRKQGPWQEYFNRMLQMRARSFALRDVFPDVLKGLISAEEAMDTAIPVEPTPQPPRRVSEGSGSSFHLGAPPMEPPPTDPTPTPVPPTEPPPDKPKKGPTPTPIEQRQCYVQNTQMVSNRDGSTSHYEIAIKTPSGTEIYVTKDRKLFDQCMSVEGFENPIVLTYLSGKKEGQKVKILQSLALDEAPAAAPDAPQLFDQDIKW